MDKGLNGKNSKGEFLIPDVFENKNRLIGIKSKKVYECGLVVYTGIDLDENKIVDKLPDIQSISSSDQQSCKDIFKSYLTQVKEMKIGKIVRLTDNYILTILDAT